MIDFVLCALRAHCALVWGLPVSNAALAITIHHTIYNCTSEYLKSFTGLHQPRNPRPLISKMYDSAGVKSRAQQKATIVCSTLLFPLERCLTLHFMHVSCSIPKANFLCMRSPPCISTSNLLPVLFSATAKHQHFPANYSTD